MTASSLVNRNVWSDRRRTSMRLEPELWEALQEICARQDVSLRDLMRRIEQQAHPGGRTSAVRVFIVRFLRDHVRGAGDAAADAAVAPPRGGGRSAGIVSAHPPIGTVGPHGGNSPA